MHVVDVDSAGGNASSLQELNRDKLSEDKEKLEVLGFKVKVKVPIGFVVREINETVKGKRNGRKVKAYQK